MANGIKYVQNTYTADIQIILKQPDGRFLKNVIFRRYVQNKLTGQVESDGFTEISAEDYKLLEGNSAFKVLVAKKRLVVRDEAPLKAGSFEQMLALRERVKQLETENQALKEKLEAYEKAGNSGSKKSKGGKKAAEETEAAEEAPEVKDEE
jgi:hypothetical protein